MKLLLVILAAVLAIALSASNVKSAGINLSWDDCGAHGVPLRTFACDTNEGSHTLVGSFVAPAGVDSMSANEIAIDVVSAETPLPNWWMLRTSLCRAGSLKSSFDFTSGPLNCHDYWQGGASGGIVMDPPEGYRARIRAVVALPLGDARITGIPEGTEVYSFKVIIDHAKTAGDGACAGCAGGVCIVLNSIRLNQPQSVPGGTIFLSNPATRQDASWQCPGFLTTVGCIQKCPTPTQARTWGQIKQIFR